MQPSKLERDGPGRDVEKPTSKPEDGKLVGSAESAVSRSENRGAKKSGAQSHTIDDRRQDTAPSDFSIPSSLDKLLTAARWNSELSQELRRKMEILRTEAEQAKEESTRWKEAYDKEVASSKLKLDEITSLSQQLKDTNDELEDIRNELKDTRDELKDTSDELDRLQGELQEQFYELQDAKEDCELLRGYLKNSINARFHGEPEDGSRLPFEAYETARARRVGESANPPTKEEQGKPDDVSTRGHEDGSKE